MLPLEHSAILLTFIKLPLSLRSLFCLFLSGSFTQVLSGRFKPHRGHYVVVIEQDIYPSLVMVQPRKTCPCLTERLLMGRKESNQTFYCIWLTCTGVEIGLILATISLYFFKKAGSVSFGLVLDSGC